MAIYCTPEFRAEVARLSKNRSYANLEELLAASYCDASFAEASTGDLLAVWPNLYYRKRRLAGAGGYRVYALAVVLNERLYLGHVQPKTGRYGLDNITPAAKKEIVRQINHALQQGTLLAVQRHATLAQRLDFTPAKF